MITDVNMQSYKKRLRKSTKAFWLTFKDRNDLWYACIKLHCVTYHAPPISNFMNKLKKEIDKSNIKVYGYEWVMEQKCKYPHYHLCIALKKWSKLPKPLEKFWKYGSIHVMYKYHIGFKYLAKAWKYMPNMPYIRKYSVGWLKKVNNIYKFHKLPLFLQKKSMILKEVCKKVPGVGWVFEQHRLVARFISYYLDNKIFKYKWVVFKI